MSEEVKTKASVRAEVTFKPYEEGGRPLMPIGSGFAPYLRTKLVDQDLAVRVNNVPDGAKHGEVILVDLELSYYPKLDYGRLQEGTMVQLVEGPKVVAEGRCLSGIAEG